MLVKQEQVSPCEVELKVEIDAEKVGSAVDDTYVELGKRVNIPGFRKGKAPREILQRYLDEDKVKDRVTDILLEPAYKEALEESKLDPWAPADVKLDEFELGGGLSFTAKVPLHPIVELGDYVGLEVEKTVTEVTGDEVDEEIQKMLDRQAEYPTITDRPAQTGDTLLVEMNNEDEGEEPKRNVVLVGDNLPDFDAGLVGMNVDEERVIEVTYPEDSQAEELRGKTIPLHTKVIEIHERHAPELNDEWVKKTFFRVPEENAEPDPDGVDTVEKLKTKVRESMERAARDVADNEVRNKLVGKIVESSKVEFPQVMVEEAVHERLHETMEELKKRKLTIDDFLKHREITAEQLHSEYEEEARQTLKTMLAMGEIIEKEGIKVEDDDIKTEIAALAAQQNVPTEAVEAYLDRTEGRQQLRNRVLQKKLMDFLVHASNIKNVGH